MSTVPLPPETPGKARGGGGGTLARVGRHTAVYAGGVILGRVVAFAMLPVYTTYLTASEYGVYALIDMTLEVISIVAGSRLGAGVFRLYHKAETDRERQQVVGSALVLVGIAYLVAGAISYFGSPVIASAVNRDPSTTPIVRLAALTLATQALVLIPLTYLRLRERSGLYVGFTTGKLLLQLLLNIVFLVQFRMGLRGLLLSSLVASIIVGVPLVGLMVKEAGLLMSRDQVRALVRIGAPFIGVQLAKFVQTFGSRYFLNLAASTSAVGIYTLAYQFGFLLVQLGFAPFISVWEPMRFEIAKRPDRDAVFNRVFLFLNVGLFTVAVGIALFVGDYQRLAAGPTFQGGELTLLVPIVLVAFIFQSWNGFNNFGLFVAEKTQLIAVADWVGAIVAVVGFAVLIPLYRGVGAAVATVLSFGASAWLTQWYAQRAFPMEYRWGPVMRVAAVATAVVIVAIILPPVSIQASIGIHIALLGVYFVLLWFSGAFSEDDRQRMRQMRPTPSSILAALSGQVPEKR
jgi:O-antigen/teichoic acid export membrane protein